MVYNGNNEFIMEIRLYNELTKAFDAICKVDEIAKALFEF